MKPSIKLLLLTVIAVMFMLKCGGDNDFKKPYYVKFNNNTAFEITNINLDMYGAEETITVSTLAGGQTSEYQTFLLPKLSQDEMPNRWGDYSGIYTQQDSIINIYIFNDDHKFRDEVIIRIENNSYSVEYPDF